jgi:hypothetical protein
MKNENLIRIFFIALVVVIFANVCNSQSITREQATKIAESVSKNILTDAGSIESGKITIKRIDSIKYEDKTIGYVFYLNPGGYVIISGFREMTPVFSMSGEGIYATNYDSVETVLKPAFVQKYLAINSHAVSNNSVERSRNMWNQYLADNN